MHILITGGSGLIGRQLCVLLLEKYSLLESCSLTVLTRDPIKSSTKFAGHLGRVDNLYSADNLNFIDSLDKIDFNQVDIVINLAGEPIIGKRWSDSQKARLIDSRVGLTKRLAQAMNDCDNPPHTFISGSAIGFYGNQGDIEIDEDFTNIKPDFSHYLCKEWEGSALQAKTDKTRVCLLRTGIVLSPEGGALAKMRLPFKLALGGPIGDGKQGMSWIHIDDMVNIILFILDNSQIKGVINTTAPQPVSNNKFTKVLANAVSRPAIFRTPSWVFKIMMGEMAELATQGQFVVPKKLLEHGFQFQYTELEPALKSFDL